MSPEGHFVWRKASWLWARVCAHGIHYVHETRQEARDGDRKDRAVNQWCGPHKIKKLVQYQKAAK